jgi:hypothetical protein
MLFTNNRLELRQLFFTAWQKYQAQLTLEPLEQQLANLIVQHPEYHAIFNNPEQYLDKDYFAESGETNPFLHLAFHQAIYEQISTDRPSGSLLIYQQLSKKLGAHEAEHRIIDVLMQGLWQLQHGEIFDEVIYLQQLQQLLNGL